MMQHIFQPLNSVSPDLQSYLTSDNAAKTKHFRNELLNEH